MGLNNPGVISFNGRNGVVEPKSGDYTAADVGAIPTSEAGADDGVATLDSTGNVPASQLGNVPAAPVSSVFGRTGAVVAETGDYTAAQVGALAVGGTAANATEWGGAKNDITAGSLFGTSVEYTGSGAALQSTGFGISFAPTSTRTRVRVQITGNNSTAGGAGWIQVYRSTAGIPAANAAIPSGDVAVGPPAFGTSAAASQTFTLAVELLDTGLTAGATYLYYIGFVASGAGLGFTVGAYGNGTGGQFLIESR